MELYKRDIFNEIERYIGDEGVIVLHGARQVGKTHILLYIQNWLEERKKKVFFYDLELPELLEILNLGINSFLLNLSNQGYKEGDDVFVLIDEIQYLDNPSSFLKIIADHNKNVHLIVSGSSSFDIKSKFSNSLAGRTIEFEVFPLTFKEFLEFKKTEYKFSKSNLSSAAVLAFKKYFYEFIKFGGYPRVVLENDEIKKKKYLIQVIDTYIRKDVRDLANITDIKKFNGMLKILASQSGQILNMPSLSRETNLSLPTLQKYLSILEETYVIKLIAPFSNSPSVEISKNPKIFMYDSGLQSILWLNNFQGTLIGSVFETNIFGELAKKYGRNNVHFWRNKQQKEIDFIIELDNLKMLPIEVKTNFAQFSQKSLNTFLKKYKQSLASETGKPEKWNVIALEGEKTIENMLYPWEI